MTALKPSDRPTAPAAGGRARTPWRKKTPVEVVFEQTDRLRTTIADREQELKDMRRQLQKFEEARKIFETT
jgi:hypothetical protein